MSEFSVFSELKARGVSLTVRAALGPEDTGGQEQPCSPVTAAPADGPPLLVYWLIPPPAPRTATERLRLSKMLTCWHSKTPRHLKQTERFSEK